ncbi:MAG TPA: hypothetical protein VKA48_08845, partial [Gammaproteobacteria bacterium]|nr:hypothetical protein [Gammaproteobacteria bacterium]
MQTEAHITRLKAGETVTLTDETKAYALMKAARTAGMRTAMQKIYGAIHVHAAGQTQTLTDEESAEKEAGMA